jgi:hypothetical protein
VVDADVKVLCRMGSLGMEVGEDLSRMDREVDAMKKLGHPNIVQVISGSPISSGTAS